MSQLKHSFPARMRLSGKLAFARVFDAKVRDSRGPLASFSLPNDMRHPRLGISIGRSVGTAPRRNRIKRLIREAFRLMQHDFPAGYDLVIVVRPHVPMILAEYQKLLSGFMVRGHATWQAKSR